MGPTPGTSSGEGDGECCPLENDPSVLSWEIPRTEDLDVLQSRVSQRVGCHLATKHHQQRRIYLCEKLFQYRAQSSTAFGALEFGPI